MSFQRSAINASLWFALKATDTLPARLIAQCVDVNRRRIHKPDAVREITQRIVDHYKTHNLESKIRSRQALLYQRAHVDSKIETLEDRILTEDREWRKKELIGACKSFKKERSELRMLDPEEAIPYLSQRYANDIAADFSPAFFVLFKYAASKFFPHLFASMKLITENEGTLERILELNGKEPIVYVPNHISNADHVPICVSLNNSGLYQPVIAAGANLFRGVSAKILYKMNAYKIRREHITSDIKSILKLRWFHNPIYRHVHDTYIKYLLENNEPMLFYIEGTRSRDGRIGEAKQGLMKTIVDYHMNSRRTIHFVPISISYTIVPEDREIEASRKGQNISDKDLIYHLRDLDSQYEKLDDSSTYVKLHEPIAYDGEKLKGIMDDIMDRVKDGIQPTSTYMLANAIFHITRKCSNCSFDEDDIVEHYVLHRSVYNIKILEEAKSILNALEAFKNRGIIEEEGKRFRVLEPDLIVQYANRIEHKL